MLGVHDSILGNLKVLIEPAFVVALTFTRAYRQYLDDHVRHTLDGSFGNDVVARLANDNEIRLNDVGVV